MAEWQKVEPEEGKESTPTWKPEKEGDTIEGVLMEKRTGVGKNKSNLYTFLCKDSEVAVWGSTVIDSRMKDIEADGVEMVKIEFLGFKDSSGGYTYRDYDVYHRPVEE